MEKIVWKHGLIKRKHKQPYKRRATKLDIQTEIDFIVSEAIMLNMI